MPDLTIAAALNEARLLATRDYLDAGAGASRLRIYNGTRPAGGGTPTTLLVEFTLAEPCGTVASNALTLTPVLPATIVASGIATWARLVDGSGNYAIDGDVSNLAGTAPVKIDDTALVAGEQVALISAVFG
jgi:hypothetical protein